MSDNIDNTSWYIWVVKVNKINKVIEFLEETLEIAEYVYPTYVKEYKLNSGGVLKKKVPLYSGYIFMRYHDTPEVFQKINTNKYITTYVGKCRGEDLDIVKNVVRLETLNSASRVFCVGDVVKVNCGPFNGFVGKVTTINSSNIVVSLVVFGRNVNVTLNKDDADIVKREESCAK
jgi:transcription antitermination factor NusG